MKIGIFASHKPHPTYKGIYKTIDIFLPEKLSAQDKPKNK